MTGHLHVIYQSFV